MLSRLEKVKEKLKRSNLDCFLFTSASNIFYLSNFQSSNAYILITPINGFFITDGRYYEKAKNEIKDLTVIQLNEKGIIELLKDILMGVKAKTVGFEKDKLTVSAYEKFKNGLTDIELVGFDGFLTDIRMVKSEKEVEIIKEAVLKTDIVYSKIIDSIFSFETEMSVRKKIVECIFEEGGTTESFPAIVASAQHSAIPHWETSSSKIEKNAPLLIDMGMKFRGYCSDFTRTFFLGKPNPRLIDIYNIVREAHLEAVSTVKAGITIKEVDLKARSVIDRYGYGEYFIHSTGHGIGIDIHEEPRVYKNNEEVLQENTVFTIEPGIYIPGLGGVRLENIVLAKKEGVEVLTQTPLDLLIL